MILFNTTFVVDPSAKADFLKWANEIFLPSIEASGIFSDALMTRILAHDPEALDAESFAVQLKSNTLEEARRWSNTEFHVIFAPLAKAHPQGILPFSTFMEII